MTYPSGNKVTSKHTTVRRTRNLIDFATAETSDRTYLASGLTQLPFYLCRDPDNLQLIQILVFN